MLRAPCTVGYHQIREQLFPHAESALWAAVLTQALYDATAPVVSEYGHGAAPATAEREQARHWLTRRSRDLEMVCDMAGVDLDGFLGWSRSLRDWRSWKMPEEWRGGLRYLHTVYRDETATASATILDKTGQD